MFSKNPTDGEGGIRDKLASFASSIAYPNLDEQARGTNDEHGRPAGEHDAAHGSRIVNHDVPETLYDKLHGDNGLRTIKTGGNQGQGHDSGLKRKGVEHQEQLAERSRIARAGEWEPHMKHDDLVAKHADIAHSSDDVPSASEVGGVGAAADEQRLV
ncbi:hypothetical protein JCM11251_005542 [Rhodosporidiobolus azoricus]